LRAAPPKSAVRTSLPHVSIALHPRLLFWARRCQPGRVRSRQDLLLAPSSPSFVFLKEGNFLVQIS
jgi:hypothetical protein